MIGVGFIGAGPVVQAIHLPTLARLADEFEVVTVTDPNRDVAARVAARVNARISESVHDLLDDPAVDVVAVCSPPRFHADQVIAAIQAGAKAVFCEKPLATSVDDAERIAAASNEYEVPVIVGAMHTYDPGWVAGRAEADRIAGSVTAIRSSIVLPFNQLFEDQATETIRVAPPDTAATSTSADSAARIREAVLGLAVHDLPLVRSFLPAAANVQVTAADLLKPFGYAISIASGGVVAEVVGHMQSHWQPAWEFEVFSPTDSMSIDFTPSFIHAGSATATLATNGHRTVLGPYSENGYVGEWETIADIVAHAIPASRVDLESAVEDLRFAVAVADGAAEIISSGGHR